MTTGLRSDLALIAEGCRNCKIPVNSPAPSLEPLNCNSFEKLFVWSAQVALGILIWWGILLSSVSWCGHCKVSWKWWSCWLILLCFRDDRTGFCVCVCVSLEKFQCFLWKKIRRILKWKKWTIFLKSEKLLTFSKVRTIYYFLKLIAGGEKIMKQ